MFNRSRGLTLLELLIVIFFLIVFVGVLWTIFKTQFYAFYSQETRSDIKGRTGRAFFTMPQELRQATSITTAASGSVTFTADMAGDGADETIQYVWSGTAGTPLNRVSGGVTTALVDSAQSAAFTYYDSGNNLLSFPVTASQVKLVAMDVTAADGDESFELRSQARCRNF